MARSVRGDGNGRNQAATVLLWGDTQVGKTTLLATGLGSRASDIKCLDAAASADSLRALEKDLRQLRNARLVSATSAAEPIDIEVVVRGVEGPVRVRDVRGGMTRELEEQRYAALLAEASVVLFLVEWKSRELSNQMGAIESAWDLAAGAQRGLVFTKCEADFTSDHHEWRAEVGWWKGAPWLTGFEPLVARFGAHVWPVSCFGFDPKTGYPAVVLGEFGQLLPLRIAPINVHRPFEWAFGCVAGGKR